MKGRARMIVLSAGEVQNVSGSEITCSVGFPSGLRLYLPALRVTSRTRDKGDGSRDADFTSLGRKIVFVMGYRAVSRFSVYVNVY
jgi:hypothetical protein